MTTIDQINAAFLQIADGFKAAAARLNEELGGMPPKTFRFDERGVIPSNPFGSQRCPQYWGDIWRRCTLPVGHDGEHAYANTPAEYERPAYASEQERIRDLEKHCDQLLTGYNAARDRAMNAEQKLKRLYELANDWDAATESEHFAHLLRLVLDGRG